MVRGKDGPERTIDVSIGVAELGVIKGVESLKAELEALGFADLRVFQQAHVPIVEPWAVEETPIRISDLPHRGVGEERRIEVGIDHISILIEGLMARIGVVQDFSCSDNLRCVEGNRGAYQSVIVTL